MKRAKNRCHHIRQITGRMCAGRHHPRQVEPNHVDSIPARWWPPRPFYGWRLEYLVAVVVEKALLIRTISGRLKKTERETKAKKNKGWPSTPPAAQPAMPGNFPYKCHFSGFSTTRPNKSPPQIVCISAQHTASTNRRRWPFTAPADIIIIISAIEIYTNLAKPAVKSHQTTKAQPSRVEFEQLCKT
ncbi:hypothetical protein CpipJ_CPIJ000941 [Culex quinquefasciatus]|uniref:Uncharacterized protein n=1 Tax=Culex quinquefasciatus TaxID=7176 RepID=B0W1M7_CULQU|nr:hypothetical protein CpipJ_CPIJ000941 [Culex quinquefasciatus]|eukprot:XP_001842611.1 hypothetical protein CpipJ_CPIJ000941 [Culex quinquefasciatus]